MSSDIKLSDLDASFRRIVTAGRVYDEAATIKDAQGVIFLCPKCFTENDGPIGTHSVICWFLDRGVPDTETPGPGRWRPEGTGMSDLSLVNGSSSVHLSGPGCGWHGWIRDGKATGGF